MRATTALRLLVLTAVAWQLGALVRQRVMPYGWEAPVIDGEMWEYGELLGTDRAEYPGLAVMARDYSLARMTWDTVRWNDGLRARPKTLFFTLPTVAALKLLPTINPVLVARAAASAAMLGTLLLVWYSVRSLAGHVLAADVAALALLAWPTFWHYGSYGCSLAGTCLSVALLCWSTLAFLRQPSWLRTAGVFVACIVATWQYAMARPAVFGVLAVLSCYRLGRRAVTMRAALCAAVVLVCIAQGPTGRWALLYGSGEQAITGEKLVPNDPAFVVRAIRSVDQNLPQFRRLFEPWTTSVLTDSRTEDIVSTLGGLPLVPSAWLAAVACAMLLVVVWWGVFVASLPLAILLAALLTSGPDLHRTAAVIPVLAAYIGLGCGAICDFIMGRHPLTPVIGRIGWTVLGCGAVIVALVAWGLTCLSVPDAGPIGFLVHFGRLCGDLAL